MNLSRRDIKKFIKARAKELLSARRKDIRLTASWRNSFPRAAGVYGIFDGTVMVYVGEGSSIRRRMDELRNTRQHIFRRHLGKDLFGTKPGYKEASTSAKFPLLFETGLNNHIRSRLKVSFLKTKLGRIEIEELFRHPSRRPKYNKR